MANVITMPKTDPALLAFSLNFLTKISATPTAYGLTASDATAYEALHDGYATTLAACDPAVRNKPAVAAKNAARAALKEGLLLLALKVQGTAAVTTAQKIELGLSVPSGRTPIPAPSTSPAIDIRSVSGRTVTVRLHGEDVLKRGKPAGVAGAAVFSYVGATPPTDPAAYKFEGNTTRTIVTITFPESVPAGATVWITAFWFNERAMSGPATAPVSTTLQYGLSSAEGLKLAA